MNRLIMLEQRLRKSHGILHKLEDVRFQLTLIGTITNPYLSESYEKELMDKLCEVESSIHIALETLASIGHEQQSSE